jgi:hypothetical protein
MRHPLEFLPLQLRKPLFYFFLIFTLIIYGVFSVLDQPLRTSAAPHGIVSFELAGSPDTAFQIMVSWEDVCDECPAAEKFKPYLYAAFGLGLDYLFMPVYALALSLGLLLAGNGKKSWYRTLTIWMGWGAFAAALFDAVENYALWKILTGNFAAPFPQVALFCAIVKFALLAAGILTALGGAMVGRQKTSG